MKTLFNILILCSALCAAGRTAARPEQPDGRSMQTDRSDDRARTLCTDTVVLSQTTEGDYFVRRLLVLRDDDTDYSVRYRINEAQLSSLFDGNSRELEALDAFVDGMKRDSLLRVRSLVVTGYASPDGPEAFNETLARNRARDFGSYLERRYGFSSDYDVRTEWVAEDWRDVRAPVAEASIPDRQAVLDILEGSLSRQAKEQRLKAMPAAWEYLKTRILPQQRRVELVVDYIEGNIVEERTLVAPPTVTIIEPCPEPVREAIDAYFDDRITGILVELPDPGTDYERELREARREVRMLERAAEERRLARMEVREARRTEREQLREARRPAR